MSNGRRPVTTEEDWRRIKAGVVAPLMEENRELYLRTQNPTHALAAYRIVRAAKLLDIPSWILELFDQWAETLVVQRPKGGTKAIADALGLGTKGGPPITSQAETQARDLRIVQLVYERRTADPECNKFRIFGEVGEEFDLSAQRVQGIWTDWTRRRDV